MTPRQFEITCFQFAKLLEDVERIRSGAVVAPPLNNVVLEEVEGALGWVRVSKDKNNNNGNVGITTSPTGDPYFWHPATGQLSWIPPQGQDALKSLDMTRLIVTDAVERLKKAAETQLPAVSPAALKAVQASTLASFLDSLAKEQQRAPLEHVGSHVSRVWCSVHACLAASVAELCAPGPPLQAQEPAPAAPAGNIPVQEPSKSDEDMDLEDDFMDYPGILPSAQAAHGGIDTAGFTAPAQQPRLKKRKPSGVRAGRSGNGAEEGDQQPLRKSKKAATGVVGGGKGPSMFNKWAAVRKEMLEDEEGMDNAPSDEDGEERAAWEERRRQREVEIWRAEQLRSGTAAANSNFAPVMGDWRDRLRLKQQQQQQDDGQAHDAQDAKLQIEEERIENPRAEEEPPTEQQDTAVLLTSASMPDLDALSAGLPEGWRAMWDVSSCGLYYGNLVTQATQWERPT